MSKKYYIFAADLVVEDWKTVNNPFYYKMSNLYINFVKFFNEFGENFNIGIFDSYIEKKLGIRTRN